MKISIIIPAHNEEKRIGRTLERYSLFFKRKKKEKEIDFEILVVLNACTDDTLKVVEGYAKKFKEIVYLDLEKGGKGYAIIEGFKDALKRDNDLIGFVDADMATSPESFYDLVKQINNYGGIIASRYVKGSVVRPKQSIGRIIASRIYNMLIRFLFLLPYRDTQCGAKLFKRKALEKSLPNIGMTKWAFDLDLIYNVRKQEFAIKEVPTVWSDKEYSTINFAKAGPWMALAVIRLRILNSPMKRFIRVYDKIISLLR